MYVYPVAQSCLTLVPGSSVHGIFWARILEWVAISTPADLPNPEIKTAALAGGFFITTPPGKPPYNVVFLCIQYRMMT